MAWKVPLADLDYGPEEERAVIDVLRSKWLTMDAVTQSFEAAFAALTDLPLGLPFKAADRGTGAYHLFPMLLPEGTDREAFMGALRDAGVQSSIHYRPIHTFSYYVERFGEISLPVTEALAAREVTLPLFPSMSGTQFEMVIEAVSKLLGES